MTDKKLPDLDAILKSDFPIPDLDRDQLGAQFDKPALKAVNLDEYKGEGWRDAAKALKGIVERLESGEDAPIKRAAFIVQRDDGSLFVHGIGPAADDMAVVALISIGLQQIQSEMLY